MSRFTALHATALAAAAVATAAIAVPSAATAADTSNQASGVCRLKVSDVLTGIVTVGVDLDNGRSTAARKATCAQVGKVVRTLASEGAERPETVNGYACTPSITGARVVWRCVYRGGRPRTTVTLDFSYRYASGGS
jgi:hypothetical protein